MRLTRVKNRNATIVEAVGAEVLFSYSTPVAARIDGVGWVRTAEKWSVTTSRHINQFIPKSANVKVVPQEYLNTLLRVEVVS